MEARFLFVLILVLTTKCIHCKTENNDITLLKHLYLQVQILFAKIPYDWRMEILIMKGEWKCLLTISGVQCVTKDGT